MKRVPTTFKDIYIGDMFFYNNESYRKLASHKMPKNALAHKTNTIVHFSEDIEVQEIDL